MKVVVLGLALAACGSSGSSSAPDATAADSPSEPPDTVTPPFGAREALLRSSPTDAGDFFGFSVGISGDGTTLAVGAPHEDSAATGIDGDQDDDTAQDSGAVFVYRRTGDDWALEAYLKASNAEAFTTFGYALQLTPDGNTLAVGAPDERNCGTGIDAPSVEETCGGAGAAYVFVRTAGVWTQQAYVKASNTRQSNQFGTAVALSADASTLVVGQPGDASNANTINGNAFNIQNTGSGAAFVFVRTGVTWAQQAYIKTSNSELNDNFGISVALSANGDVLAAGASAENGGIGGVGGSTADNSVPDAGAVFLFARTGSTWAEDAYVKASSPHEQNFFGQVLALAADGTTLAVGAAGNASNATGINGDEDDTSALQAGAVYAFVNVAGTWTQQAYIKQDSSLNGDNFGLAVALSENGDVIAATAVGEINEVPKRVGSVSLFRRTAGAWAGEFHAFASNGDDGDLFGCAVAVSSAATTLAVGAFGEDGDNNAAMDSGAVYVIR